ncbi:MAG: ABC transporter permease, partial [Polyangiaceae bacterium]
MSQNRALTRFKRNRGAALGAGLVVFLIAFAIIAPMLTGFDPNLSDFETGRDAIGEPVGPSAAHWLGVDQLFRDQLSRLAHGARISLAVGFIATLLSALVGTAVGLLSGWTSGTRWGFVDQALMGLVD